MSEPTAPQADNATAPASIPLPSAVEIAKEIVNKKIDWSYWFGWGKSVLAWALAASVASGTTYAVMREPTPTPLPVEPLVVPADFAGNPMEPLQLSCETAGKTVRWRSLDSRLVLLPNAADSRYPSCIACAQAAYQVECWTSVNGEPTSIYTTTVTIGNPKPDPKPPVPPNPNPPTPTPPNPTPPAPVDPFVAKLQAAYDAGTEIASKKKAQIGLLIALFAQMEVHSKDVKILTTGDLLADYRTAAASLLMPDALVDLRKLISAEVLATFGSDSATLDSGMRDKAISLWGRLATSLAKVRS